MGKGDKKTTKGKRFKGSYGVSRKRKSGKVAYIPKKSVKAKEVETPADVVEETTKAPVKKAAKKKSSAKKPVAKKAAPKKAAAKKKAKK